MMKLVFAAILCISVGDSISRAADFSDYSDEQLISMTQICEHHSSVSCERSSDITHHCVGPKTIVYEGDYQKMCPGVMQAIALRRKPDSSTRPKEGDVLNWMKGMTGK